MSSPNWPSSSFWALSRSLTQSPGSRALKRRTLRLELKIGVHSPFPVVRARRSAKLGPIALFERVDPRTPNSLAFHCRGEDLLPPAVICCPQGACHVRMLRYHIAAFPKVRLQVEEFVIVHQLESTVLDRARSVLRRG